MGTVRKRKPQRKIDVGRLTEDQLEFLLFGWSLDPEPFVVGSNEHRRCWDRHKATVMAMIGQDPDFPAGTRPDAWWRFEAPEPRRQLSGPDPLPSDSLYRGMPGQWQSFEDSGAAVFESEYEYLERLGLLLPGEAIPAPA